jgi:hypothetical protein
MIFTFNMSEKIIHNWKKKTFWCTFHPFGVPTYHNTVTFINNVTFYPDLNYLIKASVSYHCFILIWFCFKLSCSISLALVSLYIKQKVIFLSKGTSSNAYHPESQGALERFHQTFTNMMKTFCLTVTKIGMMGSTSYYLLQGRPFTNLYVLFLLDCFFGHSVGSSFWKRPTKVKIN